MTRVPVGQDIEAIFAMGQMEPVDHVYTGWPSEERHLVGKVSETSYRLWVEQEQMRAKKEEESRARRTELMQQVADLQRVIDELRKPPPQPENDTAALCSKLWNAEITMEEFDDQFVAAWEAEQRDPAKGLEVDGWLSPREAKPSVFRSLVMTLCYIAGPCLFIIGMWFAHWPEALLGGTMTILGWGLGDADPH